MMNGSTAAVIPDCPVMRQSVTVCNSEQDTYNRQSYYVTQNSHLCKFSLEKESTATYYYQFDFVDF